MDNPGLPPQTSNSYCLPGRAGGTPIGISAAASMALPACLAAHTSRPAVQPLSLTAFGRQRQYGHPTSDGSRAAPGIRVVGNPGEMPTQLDGSRELTAFVEGPPDRFSS